MNELAQSEVGEYTLDMATVSDSLRKALEQCGQSRYAVSKATGIPESVLSRFVHGQPLRGANLDRLAEHLGMELTAKVGKVSKTRRASR
jgi:hypothetical protein